MPRYSLSIESELFRLQALPIGEPCETRCLKTVEFFVADDDNAATERVREVMRSALGVLAEKRPLIVAPEGAPDA